MMVGVRTAFTVLCWLVWLRLLAAHLWSWLVVRLVQCLSLFCYQHKIIGKPDILGMAHHANTSAQTNSTHNLLCTPRIFPWLCWFCCTHQYVCSWVCNQQCMQTQHLLYRMDAHHGDGHVWRTDCQEQGKPCKAKCLWTTHNSLVDASVWHDWLVRFKYRTIEMGDYAYTKCSVLKTWSSKKTKLPESPNSYVI